MTKEVFWKGLKIAFSSKDLSRYSLFCDSVLEDSCSSCPFYTLLKAIDSRTPCKYFRNSFTTEEEFRKSLLRHFPFLLDLEEK